MEFLSNISGAGDIDPYRPSLFELIAVDQLRDLLQPALRYILAFYAQRYPRYLLRIVNKHDEFYAALMLLIERHYLKQWKGSFAENFYGLMRERSPQIKFSRAAAAQPDLLAKVLKLRDRDVWKSLFVLVGIPYVKAKLDDLYEVEAGASILGAGFVRNRGTEESASRIQKLRRALRQTFILVYPSLNAAYYISVLAYHIAYLFDKSPFHTPWQALTGVRIRRAGPSDLTPPPPARASRPVPPNIGLSLFNPLVAQRLLLPKLLDGLKIVLPAAMFFLKFLEWWQASPFAKQLSAEASSSIALPPPSPVASDPAPDALKNEGDSSKCGLCGNPHTNPTMIPTGYVFCYTCAYRWLEEKGCCPVTRVKVEAGVEGLRRILV
ncbi:ubiquitin-protein ligase peroxin 12 [Saitoella coloradoensis]